MGGPHARPEGPGALQAPWSHGLVLFFLKFRMTEEACRTRSQKRTLDRDPAEDDVDNKKIKMEEALSDLSPDGEARMTPEAGAGPAQGPLRVAEVNVVGRGDGPAGDGPVDMRTSHR